MPGQDFLFPVEQTLTPDYLKTNFWKCNFTSVDKPLQYWILLPNRVKVINVNLIDHDELRFTVMGQYSTVDSNPYMEVQVMYEHIKYDLNPSDWLVKKLAIMGETVLNIRELRGVSTGNYLDVLTSKEWPDGENIISRFTVLKDSDTNLSGANIFCVKASCVEADYNDQAYIIYQIVANWDLINKSEWQLAEYLFPFEYDFTEKVSFFVPNSWEIKFEEKNNTLFSRFVLLHNIAGENKGIITTHFYASAPDLKEETVFERSFKRLAEFNPEISPLTANELLNPMLSGFFTATGSIIYEEGKGSAFLKIYILKTSNGWYYFELVGPNTNLENDYWEINKRTMELIIDSFNNESFLRLEPARKFTETDTSIPNVTVNRWLPHNWSNR